MSLLPIVARELIEASRRPGTYRMRLAAAAVALVISGIVFMASWRMSPGELGMVLLVPLAIFTQVYCLLIGVFRTADCLSEEKREGTLGLLFLTDLKGYDIVLGKLVATSLNAFYGVLAIFPVMAIPLLVGGVAAGDLSRIGLVALNNMFFSLAVGMFCSSISRDERKAMVASFMTVVFFTGGLPLLGVVLAQWSMFRPWAEWLLIPSPGYASAMAFEGFSGMATGGGAKNHFLWSVSITHALGWLALALACFIVPRTWQDRVARATAVREGSWWRRLAHGSIEWRLELRRRLLAVNPCYWLSSRDRLKVWLVWFFLAVCAALWVWGLARHPREWKDTASYVCTMLVLHSVLKVWIVNEACWRFSSDRQSGALELLLSTPLPVKEIVRGQLLALERQFAAPVVLVLLVDFLFLMSARNNDGWILLCVAGMIMFLTDALTLAWVGMWLGLNSRRSNRAVTGTIARILVLPWVLWLLIYIFMNLWTEFQGGAGRGFLEDGSFMTTVWLMIGLSINLLFGLSARQRLLGQFRTVATNRFDRKG